MLIYSGLCWVFETIPILSLSVDSVSYLLMQNVYVVVYQLFGYPVAQMWYRFKKDKRIYYFLFWNIDIMLICVFYRFYIDVSKNFYTFAHEFISQLRKGNRRTQAIDVLRPLPFIRYLGAAFSISSPSCFLPCLFLQCDRRLIDNIRPCVLKVQE